MRIKSTVLQVLAAACLGAGLLYAMGIEGGAQLGQPVTDGEFVTAMVLVLAAVFFMHLGFHAPRLCRTGRRGAGPAESPQGAPEHREEPEECGLMLKKKLINLLYTLALYAKDKLLDAEIWALKCTVRTLEAQGRILDRVLKLTKEADA